MVYLKNIFILFVLSFLIFSCKKSSSSCGYSNPTTVASAAEISALAAIVPANAIKHPSGIYYVIDSVGTGSVPSICSYITVSYTGKLANGSVFDATSTNQPIGFNLYNVIQGWQYGMPLIKKGGAITLYIPPSLGYGNTAVGSIPANSNLIFNVHIVDIQ